MPKVGGRTFNETSETVRRKMRGVEPEPIREHYVDIDGTKFPPKQVLAAVTKWDRLSFTTLEAQRVLSKLGFACRRIGEPTGHSREYSPNIEDAVQRLLAVESELVIFKQALVGLTARVEELENR